MDQTPECCSICGAAALHELPDYADLARVTSDSRTLPPGGRLTVCRRCGAVQKIPDSKWRAEIADIYSDFTLDHQSGGEEQLIFDAQGVGLPRSQRIIELLDAPLGKPPATVLDFGCGRGATMKVLAQHWPQAALYGAELSTATEPELRKIPGFKQLFTCPPDEIHRRFDAVLLIHSLNTFIEPMRMLATFRGLSGDQGHLVIQLPDITNNRYNILVADCLLHFTPSVLETATRLSGFETTLLAAGALVNEITYVGRPVATNAGSVAIEADAVRRVAENVAWLREQAEQARALAAGSSKFGIFGSSMSGSWLARTVGERFDFFVDEDQRRLGRSHMGRPIIGVDAIPAGAKVFVPLAPNIARPVVTRLRARGVDCHTN